MQFPRCSCLAVRFGSHDDPRWSDAGLVAPIVLYWVQYVWINHSADGVVASMTEGAVRSTLDARRSTLDLVAGAVAMPAQTVVYLVAGWLVLRLTRLR